METTNPAGANVGIAQNSAIQAQISTAVQSKALNTVKQTGEAMVELIDNAGSLGKELGKGEQFDRLA